jgi:hypothetical protein
MMIEIRLSNYFWALLIFIQNRNLHKISFNRAHNALFSIWRVRKVKQDCQQQQQPHHKKRATNHNCIYERKKSDDDAKM